MAAGGQLRVAPSGHVLGYDLTAVLALAQARGPDSAAAAASFVPAIEAGMVTALNNRKTDG